MKLRVECGQRWYRFHSWYRHYPRTKYRPATTYYPKFRKLTMRNGTHIGWAFGPLMLFKKGI